MCDERIEILIMAKIRNCGDENEALLREDLKDELQKCMDRFAGNKITKKGMWFFLEDVDHEVAFGDEGTYKFSLRTNSVCNTCSKDGTSKCTGNTHTICRGVKVECSGYEKE